VDDGHHYDAIGFDLINDQVWEAPDHRPPDVWKDSRIQLRPRRDPIQRLLHPLGELRAKASPLRLIPVDGCVEVGLCFGP